MTVTLERFKDDVAHHTMRVLRDDGVYRHLRFSAGNSYCMGFDLITWPWHLCYTGDMGTYVFSRIEDMFEFFRGREMGRIDMDYWAQKCVGHDRDGVRRFSEDRFREVITSLVDDLVEYRALSEEDAAALREAVDDEVLHGADDERDAIQAASDFAWNGQTIFHDMWDHHYDEFTGRFRWCCYAMQWGIASYDEARAAFGDGHGADLGTNQAAVQP